MTSSKEIYLDVEEDLNLESERQIQAQYYEDFRLTKLGFRIRLTRCINMLGATGITLSLWSILFAILIALSKKIEVYGDVKLDQTFGAILLVITTIYLIMFFCLLMKNKEKNLSGVTKFLKLICSVTGEIMLIACVGVIYSNMMLFIEVGFTSTHYSLLLIVPCTIMIIILLYGIITNKSWFVAIYIGFSWIVYGMFAVWLSIFVVLYGLNFKIVLFMIQLTLIVFFKMGVFIALHSVLLDREMSPRGLEVDNVQ